MRRFNPERSGWKTHDEGTFTTGLTTMSHRQLEATATVGVAAVCSRGPLVRVVVREPHSDQTILNRLFRSLAEATRYLRQMETDTLLAYLIEMRLRQVCQ